MGEKRDRRVMWECSLSHIIHQSEQRAGMVKSFFSIIFNWIFANVIYQFDEKTRFTYN